MVASIVILFYCSLKIILAENLNVTNFLFQLKNAEDEDKQQKCISKITALISGEISKEKMSEAILCSLELIRDNPAFSGNIIGLIKPFFSMIVNPILIQNNMSFLCDFVEDAFGPKSKFYDDLLYVIQNHKEFVDYSLILLKADMEGKNKFNS